MMFISMSGAAAAWFSSKRISRGHQASIMQLHTLTNDSIRCTCREAIRVMRRQPPAARPAYHIYNLGFSAWGRKLSATACTHKATKSALSALTEALSTDLAAAGAGRNHLLAASQKEGQLQSASPLSVSLSCLHFLMSVPCRNVLSDARKDFQLCKRKCLFWTAGVTSVGVHSLSPGMCLTDLLLKVRRQLRGGSGARWRSPDVCAGGRGRNALCDVGPGNASAKAVQTPVQDTTAGSRRFFNALAEEPETVAAALAPKLRAVQVQVQSGAARSSSRPCLLFPVPFQLKMLKLHAGAGQLAVAHIDNVLHAGHWRQRAVPQSRVSSGARAQPGPADHPRWPLLRWRRQTRRAAGAAVCGQWRAAVVRDGNMTAAHCNMYLAARKAWRHCVQTRRISFEQAPWAFPKYKHVCACRCC